MTHSIRSRFAVVASLALVLLLSAALAAFAQTAPPAAEPSPGALPTAPGAEHAGEGGLTQAHPSTPSEPGKSPLEPYLITWLLPVSGLLTVFAGFYVDRRIRVVDRRRKLAAKPK
jgi:hypothetical protein